MSDRDRPEPPLTNERLTERGVQPAEYVPAPPPPNEAGGISSAAQSG